MLGSQEALDVIEAAESWEYGEEQLLAAEFADDPDDPNAAHTLAELEEIVDLARDACGTSTGCADSRPPSPRSSTIALGGGHLRASQAVPVPLRQRAAGCAALGGADSRSGVLRDARG